MSDDIWQQYAKGVQKLGAVEEAPKKEKRMPQAPLAQPQEEFVFKNSVADGAPIKKETPPQPEMLDVRVERNLSLGDVVIEAKLDLHGKTEAAAHEELLAFVEKQYHLNRRLVLVITGKGKEGASVLRTNLPRWCEVAPLSDQIRALRTAAPHHGGDGAYYVLLRKKGG